MGWYKRTKFAFDAFRSISSRITANKKTIQESIFVRGIYQYPNPTKYNFSEFNKLGAPFFRRGQILNYGFLNKNQVNPFVVNGAKRFYYVDKRQVYHFRPRGYKKWSENPRNLFIVVVIGSGIVITIYFGNLETVPYTKRTHLVLLSKSIERQLGESQFKQIKDSFKGKILPAIHPESVRVRLIAKDIIESLQKGLNKEQVWSDIGYSAESIESYGTSGDDTLKALSNEPISEGSWSKADEVLDDKWVQQSRKKGQEKGALAATGHLEGLNWEVVVVNEPVVNAFCLPGGKIVVFTGLLEHFRSDNEIATIVGHEVAHAVARHSAEGITKNLWFAIVQLVLYQFVMPDLVNTISSLFLRLPFSRRMEMEADYIGLLLIASAGYDPRVAPTVYEKLDKVTGGNSALSDYLSTHPSGKKRAQLLAHAKVMEEALLIYREVQAGKGVEGFL
ncbi:metalloprotease [Lithospermum erythrorhizon]|uniref:Metalloprotease n=1 Tax=Lithospermum erythrorhizon TaxID=34254 RepID=A0AAV3PZ30_LITER